MRIALAIYRFDERGGGAERACGYLARGLRERGHEVHLIARTVTTEAAKQYTVHPVATKDLWPGQRHVTFARGMAEEVGKERFDVVHSFTRTCRQDVLRLGGGIHLHYLRHMSARAGLLQRWFRRWNPKERAILSLERRSLAPESSRRIVAVSERVKREAIEAYGVSPERIVVIPNAVDTELFHPRRGEKVRAAIRERFGVREDEMVCLFIGRGFERKGLETLVEAMALVPRTIPVRAMIIGDGAIGAYRERAMRLRVGDRVLFLGPRDNPEDYYGAADVFVLPSVYDPFPNACLEAMSSGLPVITTRVTGIAEWIENGVDSVVVEESADVAALADAIGRMAERSVRREMGARARAKAEQLGIARHVERTLGVYEELAGAGFSLTNPATGP